MSWSQWPTPKFSILEPFGDARILDQIVRNGARKKLNAALEDEGNPFLESNASKIDCDAWNNRDQFSQPWFGSISKATALQE